MNSLRTASSQVPILEKKVFDSDLKLQESNGKLTVEKEKTRTLTNQVKEVVSRLKVYVAPAKKLGSNLTLEHKQVKHESEIGVLEVQLENANNAIENKDMMITNLNADLIEKIKSVSLNY